MNILYINGHPYKKSFHAAIAESYADGIDPNKHTIKTLSLGDLTFDPVLRYGYSERMPEDPVIKESQDLVLWADHIVFAYPVWWGMMPSLMSGWMARVFTPRYAYHMIGLIKSEKLLKGKTADLIITSRAPRFSWVFMNSAQKPFTNNLFMLSGLKKHKMLVLDWMSLKPDTEPRRKKFLARVKRYAASL